MNRTLALGAALLLAPALADAQILAGSARGAGMADAYGAVARGVPAVFYNPANLGLRGNPGFGMTLPTATLTYGTAPIRLAEISEYGGTVIPNDVKQEWLARIPTGGTFSASTLADLNGLGLSVGPVAIAVGTIGDATLALPRGAAELFLFGNAGATGTPTDQTLTGGWGQGFAASFAAASIGVPLMRFGAGPARTTLALGVTGKYVVGHALGALWDVGGTLGADPITADVRFPAVTLFNDSSYFESTGFGVDAGLVLQSNAFTIGATVSDIRNSFAWAMNDARVRDGRAALSVDSASGSFDEYQLDDPTLDPALAGMARAQVEAATFKPALRLSGAWTPSRRMLITSDFLHRTAEAGNLQAGPANTMSAGVEWRVIPFIPLRAGGAVMTGGQLWTVGTGLELGAVNLNVAYGRRSGEIGSASRLSAGLAIGGGR